MGKINLIKSQTIVYEQTISIDKEVLKTEPSAIESEYTPEELLEQKQFDEDMDQWVDVMVEKNNKEKFHYTVCENQIRYRRELKKPGLIFEEEWILIDRNNRIMNHYFIDHKKGPQMTAFALDRTTFRDMKVTYKAQEDKTDKKIILGLSLIHI